MFGIKRQRQKEHPQDGNEKNRENDTVKVASQHVANQSAAQSARKAAAQFAKPDRYNRSLLDDTRAKINIKNKAFSSGGTVRDPLTGAVLKPTQAEAKKAYGKNWTAHAAETDHKIPLEQRYEQTKNNPWLTNEDIKAASNSPENLEVMSRKVNNAKRSRSNQELVQDEKYLKDKGIKLSEDAKKKAIKSEKAAQKAMKRKDFKNSAKNMAKTGHKAGKAAAKSSGVTALSVSGIQNLTAVIKGDKPADEAIIDTVKDTGKAAAVGYITGGGLTVSMHSLSNSSSKFLQALSKSNVPGNVITAITLTGGTLKQYLDGEITMQECLIALGDKGVNCVTTPYAMAVGQALIPIPVVGAAVGAIVGATLTSQLYNELIDVLRTKELEHQERLQIIEECERAAKEARAYRQELEKYLASYFKEYQDCFDEALMTIQDAFQRGDADGVIAGANQITRKLGGQVRYNNMSEFKSYLLDDSTDVL